MAACAAAAACVLLGGCGDPPRGETVPLRPASPPDERARVRRVSDGDSFRARVDGVDERIRLLGISAPEVHPVQCGGAEATQQLRSLIEGRRVRLEFDVERRDRFGRLLAYIHAGDVFVNREMVARGYATALRVRPNVRHYDEFTRLERAARAQRRGLFLKCR